MFAAHRLHADDTTVPVLAKTKTRTGRIWVYVRDEAPFAGSGPPAAVYYYSPDRGQEHPEEHLRNWTGILQSDAYSGYNPLSKAGASRRSRSPTPSAGRMRGAPSTSLPISKPPPANAARARPTSSCPPVAIEAVKRIDAIFDIERAINGKSADERLAVRKEKIAPLVESLEVWLRDTRVQNVKTQRSGQSDRLYAAPLGGLYPVPARRHRLSHKQCRRAGAPPYRLRKKSWMFCGSDRGGQRAAVMYSLIGTCRMNNVDPEAWLRDVLARLPEYPVSKLDQAAALELEARSSRPSSRLLIRGHLRKRNIKHVKARKEAVGFRPLRNPRTKFLEAA